MSEKKEYILKRERLPPDLARLQALFDEHLSLNNEMIRALQKADGYGNHGGKKHGTVAERGDQGLSDGNSGGTGHDEASDKGQH
jgi:hypothetical protein